MATATVTGAFVILDRASRPIKRIRDNALEADAAVKSLGANLDKIGTSEQRQMMTRTSDQIRQLAGESHGAAQEAEQLGSRMEKVATPQTTRNIGSQTGAVKQLGRASSDTNRPVSELTRGVRKLGDESERGKGRLARFGASALGLRQALIVGLIPAIGLAAQGLSALGGGVVALIPRLTQLSGLAAPAATAVTGVGLAAITAKLAFQGLGKALASTGTAHVAAMKKLTPEARSFVKTLQMYKPVMAGLRAEAQRGLFPGLEVALRRMNAAVPVVRQLLRGAGQRLGNVASDAAGQFSQRGFLRDFQIIGDGGLHIVTQLGRGVINLVQAFRSFLVVGQPFTRWLADTVFGWTRQIRAIAETKRQTGALASFFTRTQASVTVLGHVARNVFELMHGVMKAATQTSGQLWDGIDRVTKRWADWAQSAKGQNDMRRYFQDIREPLRQIVGFVGDLGRGLAHMAGGSGFSSAMQSLRDAIPSLASGLSSIASTFGPVLFRALGQTIQLVSTLVGGAGGAGPLTVMLQLFTGVLTTINKLVQAIPGFGVVIGAALPVLALMRFQGAVGELARKWWAVATGARAATAAEREAMGAGGAAGVAVARGGAATGGAATGGAARAAATEAAMLPPGMAGLRMNLSRSVVGLPEGMPPGMAGLQSSLQAQRATSLGQGWLAARTPSRLGGLLRRGGGLATRVPGMAMAGMRAFAPIAGISALAGFAGTQGGLGNRVAGAVSGLSFGLLPAPTDPAQLAAAGQQSAGRYQSAAAIRARLTHLTNTLNDPSRRISGVHRFIGGGDNKFFGAGLGGNAITDDQRKQLEAEAKQLRSQLPAAVAQGHAAAVARVRQQGSQLAIGYGQAFNEYSRREGIHKAMSDTTTDVISQMHRMGPVGRQALGQNMLQWAREQAQQNPKLWGQVHELERRIKASMDSMGQHVLVVNGQILDGSKAQWSQIGSAMTDPVEQARERMQSSFTAIQQEAASALTLMGYSKGQANALIRGMDPNASATTRRAAHTAVSTKGHGAVGNLASGALTGSLMGPKGAQGMRIPGMGRSDNVSLYGMAAPGELVVSGPTERGVDRDLAMAGKPPLGARVGRGTPHYFASGGRAMGQQAGLSSQVALGGVHAGVLALARRIEATYPNMTITSATGGGHAGGSYHYKGEALDLAGPNMNAVAAWIGRTYGSGLTEGIHNPNLSIKNGKRVPASYWGPSVWAEHANHIHIALAGALGALGGATGGGAPMGGTAGQALRLRRMQAGLGVPSALLAHGYNAIAAGMEHRVNAHLGAGSYAGVPGSGGAPTANMRLGRRMMLAHGWGADQWPALKALWTRESGWNANAVNASSGAAGIAQSLGHGRVRLGDARGQIGWGLDYIGNRYGSPSAAWAHETSAGWYDRGGRVPGWGGWFQQGGRGRFRRPTYIGIGDAHVPEQVDVTPIRHTAGHGTSSTGGGGAKHVHVHFHAGAVVIQGGGAKAGTDAADALFDRLSTLLEGMGLESEVSIG